MASQNPSLKDAINEEDASDEVKKAQLKLLTSNAENLSKSDLQDLMNGKVSKLKHLDLEDLVSLKNLGNYRMSNGLPLHPHKNLKPDSNGTYHTNIY